MGESNDNSPTTYIPPAVIPPLQNELTNAARSQMAANDQFNPYGRGSNLTPQTPFAQVAFPGAQQTIYGQAGFNPANASPFFGQSAVNQATVNQSTGYGGGQGGGQGQGAGDGSPQNPQQPQNQAMPPSAQQVLAPFQQFFPGIMPTFGVPSPYGPGFNLQQTPQNGVLQQPLQSPFTTPAQQQEGQQSQSQPQSQGNSQQQPQQEAPPPPQQPQLSPQEEAMKQQWINMVLAGGGSLPTNYQNGVFT